MMRDPKRDGRFAAALGRRAGAASLEALDESLKVIAAARELLDRIARQTGIDGRTAS